MSLVAKGFQKDVQEMTHKIRCDSPAWNKENILNKYYCLNEMALLVY